MFLNSTSTPLSVFIVPSKETPSPDVLASTLIFPSFLLCVYLSSSTTNVPAIFNSSEEPSSGVLYVATYSSAEFATVLSITTFVLPSLSVKETVIFPFFGSFPKVIMTVSSLSIRSILTTYLPLT